MALSFKLVTFNVVVPGSNAVVPKSRVVNHDPVVNVATAVPLPVSVRLGNDQKFRLLLLLDEYVLVMAASAVKPPEPVQENPLALGRFSTVVPGVVCTNAILPEPNATLRVFVLLELNIPVVNVKLPKFNEPFVSVTVLVADVVKALPNVHAPATPLNVTEPPKATPLVVTVLPVVVALNVVVPVLFHTVPASSDILPDTASVGAEPVAKVTVPADTVISKQVNAPVIVTVYVPA